LSPSKSQHIVPYPGAPGLASEILEGKKPTRRMTRKSN
jgi:hypothetical protein